VTATPTYDDLRDQIESEDAVLQSFLDADPDADAELSDAALLRDCAGRLRDLLDDVEQLRFTATTDDVRRQYEAIRVEHLRRRADGDRLVRGEAGVIVLPGALDLDPTTIRCDDRFVFARESAPPVDDVVAWSVPRFDDIGDAEAWPVRVWTVANGRRHEVMEPRQTWIHAEIPAVADVWVRAVTDGSTWVDWDAIGEAYAHVLATGGMTAKDMGAEISDNVLRVVEDKDKADRASARVLKAIQRTHRLVQAWAVP
jgi:hypothetical protein